MRNSMEKCKKIREDIKEFERILEKFRTKKLFKENSLSLDLVILPNLFSYDVIVRRKS